MSHSSKHKRRHHRSRKSPLRKALIGTAVCIVLILGCFMVYVIGLGTGIPTFNEGEIATQLAATEPVEEEPTTEPPTVPTTEPPTTEPPTTEPPTTEPPLEPYEESALALLETLSLDEKIWQMIFVTPDELTSIYNTTAVGETTKNALKSYPIGGLVFFGQNITSKEQVKNMTTALQANSKIPLFIAVDEEGGRVSRLSKIGVTRQKSPMREYGDAGDAEAVYALGQEFAQQLSSAGFNLDYAPVADVVTNAGNTEIGDRSFGTDPAVVSTMAVQMLKGLQDGKVISCLKHFPGHGSTSADSHLGRSLSNRTLDELRQLELIPFRAGIEAGAELVMISHMALPKVTGNEDPCEFSSLIVTDLLREELGFEGLIVTDSQEMGAITSYGSGEAALRAVQAGCDVITMPDNKLLAFNALKKAVEDGVITEERINESVLRILSLKYKYGIITE